MALSVVGIAAILFSLAAGPRPHQEAPPPAIATAQVDPIQVVGPGLISVAPGSAVEKQFELVTVEQQQVTFPLLTVSGSIIARIRSGSTSIEDRWQFDRPELSEVYADWVRANNEIEFAQSQVAKIRELSDASTSYSTLR